VSGGGIERTKLRSRLTRGCWIRKDGQQCMVVGFRRWFCTRASTVHRGQHMSMLEASAHGSIPVCSLRDSPY
jgi:hypothetical protein